MSIGEFLTDPEFRLDVAIQENIAQLTPQLQEYLLKRTPLWLFLSPKTSGASQIEYLGLGSAPDTKNRNVDLWVNDFVDELEQFVAQRSPGVISVDQLAGFFASLELRFRSKSDPRSALAQASARILEQATVRVDDKPRTLFQYAQKMREFEWTGRSVGEYVELSNKKFESQSRVKFRTNRHWVDSLEEKNNCLLSANSYLDLPSYLIAEQSFLKSRSTLLTNVAECVFATDGDLSELAAVERLKARRQTHFPLAPFGQARISLFWNSDNDRLFEECFPIVNRLSLPFREALEMMWRTLLLDAFSRSLSEALLEPCFDTQSEEQYFNRIAFALGYIVRSDSVAFYRNGQLIRQSGVLKCPDFPVRIERTPRRNKNIFSETHFPVSNSGKREFLQLDIGSLPVEASYFQNALSGRASIGEDIGFDKVLFVPSNPVKLTLLRESEHHIAYRLRDVVRIYSSHAKDRVKTLAAVLSHHLKNAASELGAASLLTSVKNQVVPQLNSNNSSDVKLPPDLCKQIMSHLEGESMILAIAPALLNVDKLADGILPREWLDGSNPIVIEEADWESISNSWRSACIATIYEVTNYYLNRRDVSQFDVVDLSKCQSSSGNADVLPPFVPEKFEAVRHTFLAGLIEQVRNASKYLIDSEHSKKLYSQQRPLALYFDCDCEFSDNTNEIASTVNVELWNPLFKERIDRPDILFQFQSLSGPNRTRQVFHVETPRIIEQGDAPTRVQQMDRKGRYFALSRFSIDLARLLDRAVVAYTERFLR